MQILTEGLKSGKWGQIAKLSLEMPGEGPEKEKGKKGRKPKNGKGLHI